PGLPVSLVFPAWVLNHCCDDRDKAASVVPLLETRRDLVVDDQLALDIRQRAFLSVSRLDEYFVILHKYEKRHAIIVPLLADVPRTCHSQRVILDRGVALHLGKNS